VILLLHSDDDDEDVVMAAPDPEKGADGGDDETKMDVDVPAKPDPYQFYIYTAEELDAFSQRQLVADVALYEGTSKVTLKHCRHC